MGIDRQRTVAEIALERPQAAAIFEKLGIDYCCGRRKPLATACEAAGIDVNRVANLLEEASGKVGEGNETTNWSKESLANLISHIVEKHHAYCREEGLRWRRAMSSERSERGTLAMPCGRDKWPAVNLTHDRAPKDEYDFLSPWSHPCLKPRIADVLYTPSQAVNGRFALQVGTANCRRLMYHFPYVAVNREVVNLAPNQFPDDGLIGDKPPG